MSRNYLKIPGIAKQEITVLFLTMLQALFAGIYLAGFDITMHAVFLDSYTTAEFPEIYISSGILGIVLMFFYIFFSTRMKFRLFVLFNYLVVFFLSVIIYFYSSPGFNKEYIKFGFALMFPMNIILFLTYWRSMREVFTPRQTKRLFVYLQVSFYGGMVAASYGIIYFLFQTREFQEILIFSSLSLLLVILLQLVLNPVHRYAPAMQHKAKISNPLRSKYTELFYTRFTVLLLLFVILSGIIGYTVHFGFITASRTSYPDIVGFSKFLGLFTGTLFLMVFLVDKLLIRKILYSYDSPYSLVLIPVVMLFLLLISVVIYLTLGSTTLIARFSFYFITIAMLKAAYEIARYEIEIPSLSVVFKTLDVRFNNTIIPRIEGTTRLAGLMIAGVILFMFVRFRYNNFLFLNLLTILIVIGWTYVAVRLIKKFQNALQQSIRRFRATKNTGSDEFTAVDEKLLGIINHGSFEKIISSLRISEKTEPVSYENHIINLLNYNEINVGNYALAEIDRNNLIAALQTLKNTGFETEELTTYKDKLIRQFEQRISTGKSEKQIEKLAVSTNINDRVLCADLIGYLNRREYAYILINLSRDFEPDVKQAAIKSMARTAFAENSHTLVGFLNAANYYSYAFEALVKIGDEACEHLDQLFLSKDADNRLLSRIVKIFGKIGTEKAVELLLNKVEKQNKFIARQSITALREARFQASMGNINRILNAIVRTINILAWNYNILNCIPSKEEYSLLLQSMNAEIEDNYHLLYQLLSLAYNSNTISNIRKLIEKGSDTDTSFAIELLDQMVYDDVKKVLFPVIENLSVKEKIKQLQYFFPTDKISRYEILPELIIRDYNQLSVYVKACAIFSWTLTDMDVDNILVSCIFHPNKLIRESAAYAIDKIKPEMLEEIFTRLDPVYVKDINLSLENIKSGNDILTLEKIMFLKKCKGFHKIQEDILLEVSIQLNFQRIPENREFLISGKQADFSLILIYSGSLEVSTGNSDLKVYTPNDVIYVDHYLIGDNSQLFIKATEESVIFTLNRDVLGALIFDYTDIKGLILELIENVV